MKTFFQERESLFGFAGIHISPSHVPVVFAVRFGDRNRVVFWDLVDVSECYELVKQCAVFLVAQRYSFSNRTGDRLPTGNGFDRTLIGEDVLEHPAFHVLANRQPKVMQHRRGDIQ